MILLIEKFRMGENDWVTPKMAVKKRRASVAPVLKQRKLSVPDRITQETGSDSSAKKSAAEKFNPFLKLKKIEEPSSPQDSIGIGSNNDSSNDSNKDSQSQVRHSKISFFHLNFVGEI